MPEAAAMRFLHGVVGMTQLADKLKQEFPDDADWIMEEVRLCARVGVGVGLLMLSSAIPGPAP